MNANHRAWLIVVVVVPAAFVVTTWLPVPAAVANALLPTTAGVAPAHVVLWASVVAVQSPVANVAAATNVPRRLK